MTGWQGEGGRREGGGVGRGEMLGAACVAREGGAEAGAVGTARDAGSDMASGTAGMAAGGMAAAAGKEWVQGRAGRRRGWSVESSLQVARRKHRRRNAEEQRAKVGGGEGGYGMVGLWG